MRLGELRVKDFLDHTAGQVRGQLVSDGKVRTYSADYGYRQESDGVLVVWKVGSSAPAGGVRIPATIQLDEPLVAFFGFYSGDGAKGGETPGALGVVRPSLSISQTEPNLIRYSIDQFRKVFPGSVAFTFTLGEDAAYFMAGTGYDELRNQYGGVVPPTPRLSDVRPQLDSADARYLLEVRNVAGTNVEHLAFYYTHKAAMEAILVAVKTRDLTRAQIQLGTGDRVKASLRRPFKKGARLLGGSSRADETKISGVSGLGELFLKMLHEVEHSILADLQVSTQGLVHWDDTPSSVGEIIDIQQFFSSHPYGSLAGRRPTFTHQTSPPAPGPGWLVGQWPASKATPLRPALRIDPLWCYTAGLYLAEGTTAKSEMLTMFRSSVSGLGLGFTSSENNSLELVLRSLARFFPAELCLDAWKVKVGSQYFPELVVVGLKNAVPMIRGGASGDGKLRTMEISLPIKDWALAVAPSLQPYAERYSHVEPTGAGVARIDFWASSSLCRWYFPLLIYATFGQTVANPTAGFF